MNYISTKDASSKWKISSRRIEMLASEGRISGAVLVGKNWIIPDDAEKPMDGRKTRFSSEADNKYVFPYPVTYERFGKLPADASQDEIELQKAHHLFESGDFEESLEIAKNLYIKTKNKYIRIGVLYLCFFSYVCLFNFNKADELRYMFLTEYSELTEEEHKYEIEILLHDIEAVSNNNIWYVNEFKIEADKDYSDGMLAYSSILTLFRDAKTLTSSRSDINILAHEVVFKRLEKEGYLYTASLLGILISNYYGFKGNHELENAYFDRSVKMITEGRYFVSVTYYLSFAPDLAYKLLNQYSPEIRKKYVGLIEKVTKARTDYLSAKGRNILFAKLTVEDFKYISYCLKGYKIEDVAEMEGISLSTAKRYLAYLYDKVGVKGKKQLMEKYSSAIFEFEEN